MATKNTPKRKASRNKAKAKDEVFHSVDEVRRRLYPNSRERLVNNRRNPDSMGFPHLEEDQFT